jgi:hypothetical protein
VHLITKAAIAEFPAKLAEGPGKTHILRVPAAPLGTRGPAARAVLQSAQSSLGSEPL